MVANFEKEFQKIIDRLPVTAKKYGMKINVKKTIK